MERIVDISEIKLTSINQKYIFNPRIHRLALSPKYAAMKRLIESVVVKAKCLPPYKVVISISTYLDLDAPIKCVLDAIKPAITDDRDIVELHVYKEPLKRGVAGYLRVDIGSIAEA